MRENILGYRTLHEGGEAAAVIFLRMPAVEIDGARIYYEERGTGPAMLLIAGTGGHTATFSELAPILAKTHRVISYDRRGFSRTGGAPPSRAYVVRQHVFSDGRWVTRQPAVRAGAIRDAMGIPKQLFSA